MANIDQYIEQIANARYGNEVRSALINALEAMNAEISASGVSSFNSRTGNVVPAKDDYNISQIASTGGLEGQVPVANMHGGFTMRDIHGEIDMLNQMDDVTISNPINGQVLKYNNGEWENADESGGGTSNYNDLSNKPSIGGITLTGNKTLNDLSIMPSNGVVANPSGSATSNLTKIQIGQSIYGIPETQIFSATADGVKTWKEILYPLFESVNLNDLKNPDNIIKLAIVYAGAGSPVTPTNYMELYGCDRTPLEYSSESIVIQLSSTPRYTSSSGTDSSVLCYSLRYWKGVASNFYYGYCNLINGSISNSNNTVPFAGSYARLCIIKAGGN